MKRNRLFILGIVTVLVALLSLTLVSGTYAKYTSSATSAVDSARVAKWDIEINDDQLGKVDDPETSETNEAFVLVFDLFNTVKEADGTTAEEHVVSANADTVIAPGTGGSVQFKVQNLSEVTADVTFTVVEANSNNIPVEFNVNGGAFSYTSVQDAFDAALSLNASHTKTLDPNEASATTITIGWRWAFVGTGSTNFTSTQTDPTDTTLGLAGTATYTVQLTVTAVQRD